jgi:uncharacterized protein YwgA
LNVFEGIVINILASNLFFGRGLFTKQNEFLLALLYAVDDAVDGRTTIQKLAYFASVRAKIDMGYFPHYYGPYSSEVATNLENLVALDFLVETGRSTMHNRIMYRYYLTKDGEALAKRIEARYPEEFAIIENVVKKCGRIVHYNMNVLSWAAKVHYILTKSAKPLTYSDAVAVGKSFGWKLSEKEIQSAVKLLSALKLIKKT